MKKSVIASGIMALWMTCHTAVAQQPAGFQCGLGQQLAELMKSDPTVLQRHEQSIQDAMAQYTAGLAAKTMSATPQYTIPIVFHIIHMNGVENISDAQIQDAVVQLNIDYQKLNPDTAAATPPFDTIIGNPRIIFRLAQKDYFGNCTNGIERIYSSQTNIGKDYSKLSPWPRDKYLNIWVVKQMENGVAGYSYYPSAVAGYPMFQYDGVIILSDYIGTIGTGSAFHSTALTHEIGHYLNLPHTWGSTNSPEVSCGDDGIMDTPPTQGHLSCAQTKTLCTFVNGVGQPENIQNYMEYSYCSVMYTRDQVTAMHAALNSQVSNRNNLWSAANLAFTGVLNPSPCKPKAGFYPTTAMICNGNTVAFNPNITNGTATSVKWYFPTGTPSVSTSFTPSIAFTGAISGWQPVSMVVTNAQGTDSIFNPQGVYVSYPSNGADFGPDVTFQEGFEDWGQNQKWMVGNPDGDAYGWGLTSDGYNSSSAYYIANSYSNLNGNIDYLISPSIDMSKYTSAVLNFKWAFATRAGSVAGITDVLKVYASSTCGKTWNTVATLTGGALVTSAPSPNTTADFFPVQASEWGTGTYTVTVNNFSKQTRFKFEYTSSGVGNNLFLDNINLSGVVGISEMSNINEFVIYPNPNNGRSLNVTLETSSPEALTLSIMDVTGREVMSKQLGVSESNIVLNESEMPHAAGVYFVQVKGQATFACKKLVIEN